MGTALTPGDDVGSRCFVFDTSPLSHLAKAQLLGVLKALTDGATCVITEVVEQELRAGVSLIPELRSVIGAGWLDPRPLMSSEELEWYHVFSQRLVGRDGRNRGETSVLAWAMAHPGSEVVVDDAEGRKIAREHRVPCRGTLRFVIDAVNDGHLGRQLASRLSDEIVASGSRLPFGSGGFLEWADRNGLLTETE